MSLTIKELSFINDESSNQDPLTLKPGSVTLFVGANNSGKSQALRDIEALCLGTEKYKSLIVKQPIKINRQPKSIQETKKLLGLSLLPKIQSLLKNKSNGENWSILTLTIE